MDNFPLDPEHFTGGRRLTTADTSEGSGPLYALLNDLQGASRSVVQMSRIPLDAVGTIFYYTHRGPDATIASIDAVTSGSILTADATLTAAIGATPVTTGVVTIPLIGTGAGVLNTATPTAANVLTDGDILSLELGGGNTAVIFGDVSIHLTY